jgi:hypothetical protein
MSELKTKVNKASVTDFLGSISDDAKRTDSYRIVEMLRTATKTEPKMWGAASLVSTFTITWIRAAAKATGSS